jgi:hypothetical protein
MSFNRLWPFRPNWSTGPIAYWPSRTSRRVPHSVSAELINRPNCILTESNKQASSSLPLILSSHDATIPLLLPKNRSRSSFHEPRKTAPAHRRGSQRRPRSWRRWLICSSAWIDLFLISTSIASTAASLEHSSFAKARTSQVLPSIPAWFVPNTVTFGPGTSSFPVPRHSIPIDYLFSGLLVWFPNDLCCVGL